MDREIKKYTTCAIEYQNDGAEICRKIEGCSLLEAEKEQASVSLIAHLSEQRHDFFNLLQVLYGYTQLKKSDKVLEHIKDYCRQMENIGRLYNCKCIKLADLLYTKDKEAESIDLNLEIFTELSTSDTARMLDAGAVLHAVDHSISAFMYALDENGYKNAHLIYNLREESDIYRMEIYCEEIRNGQLKAVDLVIPDQVIYWKKIAKGLMCFEKIAKHCTDSGFDVSMLEDGVTFALSIHK